MVESASHDERVQPSAPVRINLHLQQLAYVRELERADTLTEAAHRLQVSQSALSQSLSELERRLGTPLIERDGRQRRFTEAGREVARFATDVLGRAAELENWLEAYREGESGTLRIGMIDAASLYVLPRAISEFRTTHPGVQLRLVVETSGELIRRLRRFELDLAFVVGPGGTDLDARELLREPLYVYGPPGASGRPADANWVLYPAGSQTRNAIDLGLSGLGISPRVVLESHNPEVLRQMVALGLGWSVLPSAVAESGDFPLVAAGGGAPVAERVLLAVRRRSEWEDARVTTFLDLAEAAIGGWE
jgi:DNA-binding transcriptional LysR family regulator